MRRVRYGRARSQSRSLSAAGPQQRPHLARGAQARLDRAVDEAAPAVGEVGAREHDPALGHAHRRVVLRVPAGPVDRPGAARELVGEPVVRRRVDDLEAGDELVERALQRLAVVGVDDGGVAAEADQELEPSARRRSVMR